MQGLLQKALLHWVSSARAGRSTSKTVHSLRCQLGQLSAQNSVGAVKRGLGFFLCGHTLGLLGLAHSMAGEK